MTPVRRKLSMQLTPLLDLLLIVIFAQYMDVREHAGRAEASAATMSRALDATRTATEQLQSALAEALAAVQAALARERLDRTQYDRSLQTAVERQQLLGRLMVDLFSIPPEVVEALLRSDRPPPVIESSEDFARLREQFRELAAASPGEMVRHLLTYGEVQKQCDIWELHVHAAARQMQLEANGEVRSIDLPLDGTDELAGLDAAAFEQALYTLLKSLPQPKGLVFVTLTYDFNLRGNLFEPVLPAIDRVVDRLRTEAAGRSRFEFANLGMASP